MKASSSTDSPSVDLSILFSALSHPYVAFERNLVIAAASDEYLRQTMTMRKDVIGRRLEDAFPTNPSGTSETLDAMRTSIEEVFANGK